MSKKINLFVIDPQVDFCDPSGALYVNGAEHDMDRLANMVNRLQHKIDDIHITLDSHHLIHIAHPIFWRNSKGEQPKPFTMISAKDVENGVWTTKHPSHYKKALDYLKALEATQRYVHVIWNPHCLIASPGHSVMPNLFAAVKQWEEQEFGVVDYVTKGSNVFTEHFSVLRAEVPEPNDPSTQINTTLVQILEEADEIVCAGEALSHCLATSITDLANNFGNADCVKKLVLLTDATSPVTSFEKYGEDFIKNMTARGMRLSTTVDYLK